MPISILRFGWLGIWFDVLSPRRRDSFPVEKESPVPWRPYLNWGHGQQSRMSISFDWGPSKLQSMQASRAFLHRVPWKLYFSRIASRWSCSWCRGRKEMRKRRCLSSCQKALHVKSPEKPFRRCRSHLKHQCQDTASEALSKRSGRGPYNCTTSWMEKIKMELVHCSTSAMTNMSPISSAT